MENNNQTENKVPFFICPKCRTHYDPIPEHTHCKICDDVKLMTCEEYRLYKVSIVKAQKAAKESNTTTVNQQETSSNIFIVIFIIVFILICLTIIKVGLMPSSTSSNSNSTCIRCHQTFTDSGNKSSIAYSGYCEDCRREADFLRELQSEIDKEYG